MGKKRTLLLVTVMCAAALASFEACSTDSGTADGGSEAGLTDTSNDATKIDAAVDAGDAAKDSSADANVDAPVEAGSCTSSCGTPNCGACPTTGAISIYNSFANVTYKVDDHEVTNSDYAAFLAANVAPSTQPAICAFNKSFVPTANWPQDAGANPVANVNWCDALAYCTWANKRLCGSISDGGAVDPVYRDNGDQSEWFNACVGHHGGSGPSGWQTYPYGDGFDASACNGQGYGADATIPVEQAAGCVGGFDGGLYDMSGNVAEWENSCIEQDGGPGQCGLRGGGFGDDAGNLRCAITQNAPRTQTTPSLGIRCCSN